MAFCASAQTYPTDCFTGRRSSPVVRPHQLKSAKSVFWSAHLLFALTQTILCKVALPSGEGYIDEWKETGGCGSAVSVSEHRRRQRDCAGYERCTLLEQRPAA